MVPATPDRFRHRTGVPFCLELACLPGHGPNPTIPILPIKLRDARPPEQVGILSRTASRQEIAANRLIERLMKSVLCQAPGATRIRLALIQSDRETGHLRYDVTNSVAVRGRAIGTTPRNRPLSDWSGFLPALLAGHCVMATLPRDGLSEDGLGGVAVMRARVPSARILSPRTTRTLACPVAGADQPMVGALFILWDGIDCLPLGDSLPVLMAAAQRVATQIALVLDLS